MKRFLLAASIFSIWYAIAGTYYTFVIKDLQDVPDLRPKKELPNKKKTTLATQKNALDTDEKSSEVAVVEPVIIDTLTQHGFILKDGDQKIKQYFGNFKIYKDAEKVAIPKSMTTYGWQIATYMDSIDAAVNVIGYYATTESETTGNHRASFIRERLSASGIPDSLITINAKKAQFVFNNNQFKGGIDFNFKKIGKPVNIYVTEPLVETPYDFTIDTSTALQLTPTLVDDQNKKFQQMMDLVETETPEVTNKSFPQKQITKRKSADTFTFSITANDFKNGKFKPSKNFKTFLQQHKELQHISLTNSFNRNTFDQNELTSAIIKYISKKQLLSNTVTYTKDYKSGSQYKEEIIVKMY